MRCSACGEKLQSDAKFCSECGTPVTRSGDGVNLTTVAEALREGRIHPNQLAAVLLEVMAHEPKSAKPENRRKSKAASSKSAEISMGGAVTPEELSSILGVSKGTLNQWRCRGYGPKFLKVGRQIHYPKNSVDEFVRAASEESEQRWERKTTRLGAKRQGSASK